MKYDFDKIILRNGTNAIKWDGLDKTFGAADILPMWVADMDFEAPQPVIDAMVKRAQHGIYGYTEKPESFYSSVSNWMKKRHGWQIDNEWIEVSAGVVPAISLSILSYSEPGDKILLQSPVYYPFFSAIENNNRVIVNNRLKYESHQYTIDFKDLESKLKTGVKVIILCNPHNPVGRVWSREELEKIGELCIRYNVVIVSDEIHSDLIFGKHIHIPMASISEELAERTVTCMAPSKTFNIAGLYTSAVIISDDTLRDKFKNTMNRLNAEA